MWKRLRDNHINYKALCAAISSRAPSDMWQRTLAMMLRGLRCALRCRKWKRKNMPWTSWNLPNIHTLLSTLQKWLQEFRTPPIHFLRYMMCTCARSLKSTDLQMLSHWYVVLLYSQLIRTTTFCWFRTICIGFTIASKAVTWMPSWPSQGIGWEVTCIGAFSVRFSSLGSGIVSWQRRFRVTEELGNENDNFVDQDTDRMMPVFETHSLLQHSTRLWCTYQ